MSNNFLRWIFIPAFLSISFCSWAADPDSSETRELYFHEKKILKKGVNLSDLHLTGFEGKKDVHLKYSKAMRFDANYAPKGLKPCNIPIAEIKKQVDRAHALHKMVMKSQAYSDILNGKDVALPIAIRKQVGNKQVLICLDSIIFTPEYAYSVLYAIIEDTKNADTLSFWARDIRFTKDGGFTGDARLELLETYDLKFGNNINVSFLVDQTHENFLTFNCDGFKQLHIDARVFFSRDLFLPEETNGTIIPNKQVTVDFMTDMQSLDNWIVQISNVPKFQVVGMEGVSFQLNALAFDYSSYANPTGIVFPTGYTSTGFTSGDADMWEGFYINGLIVTLPPEFKKRSSTQRISLTLNNAIIDKLGFSGKASVQNLIPLSEGEMGKWNYSLDDLGIEIVKNTPVGVNFSGHVVMPITKEDEKFRYSASIQPNNHYNFTLTTASNLHFPLWGGSAVDIYPDSWISISLIDKKFVPVASLTGKFSLTSSVNGKEGDNNTSDKNSNLSLAEISFIKLIIRSEKPVISLDPNGGGVSFGSPALKQKMSNLPVSITDIGLFVRDNGLQMGLRFTILVNLVGENDSGGGFSGNATITVWAKQNLEDKWKYYNTELNRIELNNIKIACLTIGGFIEFYRDDIVYGSGFSGGLNMNIELSGGTNIGIKVVCIFGKKDVPNNPSDIYRYWAVDAMVSIPAITLYPGVLLLNAFGGGASYRMGIDNTIPNAKFISNSGVGYVPDYNKGLGLKAMVGIQGATRKIYEGQIILEIVFNAGGGLSMIAFSGYVQIASLGNFDQLAKLKSSVGGFVSKVKAAGGGSIQAQPAASGSEVYGEITKMADGGALLCQWRMVYDRDHKTFSANIDMFVDVAKVIKGRNPYSHAGRIDILFSPATWHVFVGRPDYAMGITVVDFLDISTYVMMGQGLPSPFPMPNGKVAAFPTVPVSGMGIGARLSIDAKHTGSFWYEAYIASGFDILIWNAAGEKCSGVQKGVKNWYAAGQAFLYGKLGVGYKKCENLPYPCNWHWACCARILRHNICACYIPDVCHQNTCIDININLVIDISAMFQGPNPTYIEGTASILGKSVQIKKGKKCV